MKPSPLIRWIYRLFDTLFYGQIALYILAICFPLIISLMMQWQRTVTSNGTRIIYDTTATKETFVSSETRDSTGKILSRTEAKDGFLITTDSTGKVISQYLLDSLLKKRDHSQPDAELMAIKKRQERNIDSILKADPEAVIYKLRNGYTRQGGGHTHFTISISIPIAGTLMHINKKSPAIWKDTLTTHPDIQLKQGINNDRPYQLAIAVSSWAEFKQVPVTLMFLGISWLLLYVLSFLWVTYLFRQTFKELANGLYFDQKIWQRCQKIGWIFVGSFVVVNLLQNICHAAAWHFIIQKGYFSHGQTSFLWPDYWMWLWAGLILMAFAQAFRYGSQLQHDHDLTI